MDKYTKPQTVALSLSLLVLVVGLGASMTDYANPPLGWSLVVVGLVGIVITLAWARWSFSPWPSRWRRQDRERQDRIEAVVQALRGLLVDLSGLCEQLESTGDERPLEDWKRRVKRFLDANIASDKVTPFHALATEVRHSGQPRDHIRSSCAAHRRFLRELQEDVVAGYEPVTDKEGPSGRGIPSTKGFIYRSE